MNHNNILGLRPQQSAIVLADFELKTEVISLIN